MDDKQHFSLWYFAGVMLLLVAVQSLLGDPRAQVLAYSDFQGLLQSGRIREVIIGDDQLTGIAKGTGITESPAAKQATPASAQTPPADDGNNYKFVVARVPDPNLIAELQAAKVKFGGRIQIRWFWTMLSWIAPALIFVVIWGLVMRRMSTHPLGGMMDVGKSKAKVYVQKKLDVKFADVEGIDEAKEELIEVVDFLKTPERYRRLGGKIPKGVLIVGAPGTGKTLLARAVAGEAQVPFLSLSGSEFVEMFVGVGAARVRDLFQQAEKLAPCIIFIDELDALGRARGAGGFAGNEEREQTLNQLLVQMDGFDTSSGIIIMAATNRPEILDPALLRPGRFDRHVAIDRPDIRGREKILKVHAKNLTLGPDVNLSRVAAKTPGCVGADLANIVNEAALRAARDNKAAVDMADFDEAIDRVVAGLEKKNRVMNSKEKDTVAHHEAGHALVAESRPLADRVSKISIIPRGIGALGFTQQVPTEDRYLLKYGELLDRLDVLLGGRVAEQLVYGEISTGAQNDLQRATDMARHMVTQYGMSPLLGPVTLQNAGAGMFLPETQPAPRGEFSERTAQSIDEEVRRLLNESEQRVHVTLTEKRAQLDALAAALLEHETVDRSALLALMNQVPVGALQPVSGIA